MNELPKTSRDVNWQHAARAFALHVARASVPWVTGAVFLGCMPQHQGEIESLRAEVKALAAEVALLKVGQPTPPASDAQTANASDESAPLPVAKSIPWAERKEAFDGEKVDNEWARLHQSTLLKLGVQHIEGQGATLQSVACKTTACLLIVDVPEKRAPQYKPMLNPWADTEFVANQESIYNGKTRWSYLLVRHPQDYPRFGQQRVNPRELALAREKAGKPAAGPTVAKSAEPPASPAPKAPGTAPAHAAQPAAKPGNEVASVPEVVPPKPQDTVAPGASAQPAASGPSAPVAPPAATAAPQAPAKQ